MSRYTLEKIKTRFVMEYCRYNECIKCKFRHECDDYIDGRDKYAYARAYDKLWGNVIVDGD